MDERDIERLAPSLGERAAAGLDAASAAASVVRRLRRDAARPPWRRPVVLRWAAAVTLALGAAVAGRLAFEDGAPQRSAIALVELEGLPVRDLTAVLDSLEFEAPVHELVEPTVADLTAQELEQLLQWMEG